MRSTALEAIFKKNKTFRKNIFSKQYFESDKYAHKPENQLAQPHSMLFQVDQEMETFDCFWTSFKSSPGTLYRFSEIQNWLLFRGASRPCSAECCLV